jgi:integrase
MPQWDGWTLAEMSANPRAVKTWHAKLSKTIPTTADHCARLIRACYREEARLDRTLNPADSPTSGIRLGKIKVSKAVLDFPDFSAWRKAWDKIENPVHKGYHLAALLTGCRPTELAMIHESDIDLDARRMIIRNAKAGNDISLPITGEIAFALAMAINAPPQTITMKGLRGMERGEVRVIERKKLHHEIAAPDLIFPGVRQAGHRSGLPVSGNALRHTFRSIAVSLEISEMLISFLMGHSLQGVSARYTNELMIANSQALREAQERPACPASGGPRPHARPRPRSRRRAAPRRPPWPRLRACRASRPFGHRPAWPQPASEPAPRLFTELQHLQEHGGERPQGRLRKSLIARKSGGIRRILSGPV